MASAGPAVSGVEEVLRARANARRIKEHYEGTLGVPSELHSLSHFLAHDKDAVFAGLEHLPSYNKTNYFPPPLPSPPPELPQPPQPPRRRTYAQPVAMPSFSTHLFPSSPYSTATGTPPRMSTLGSDPWVQNPATPTSSRAAATGDGAFALSLEQQQALSTAMEQQQQQQQEQQYPLEPGCGPNSGGRILLPSGSTLDPWKWTPSEDLGQAPPGESGNTSKHGSESILVKSRENQPSSALYSPQGPHRPHPHQQMPLRRDNTASGGRPPALQRPESRGVAASPCSSSCNPSPTALVTRGSLPDGGLDLGDFGGFPRSPSQQGGTGFGSRTVSRSPTGIGFCSTVEFEVAEMEEERKARLARQRLLSANDLTPQEWARIGPPQDAADKEKFIARSYSVTVGFDRQTLMPQRVARPDIFHISRAEAQRRQVEADNATLALQAKRRAEEEAAQQAAELEAQARSRPRGPRYDAMGVRQVDARGSQVLPRYLDWHPSSIGGLGGRSQSCDSGGAGDTAWAAAPAAAVSSPRGPRCMSAIRSQSESAAAPYGGGVVLRRSSTQEQQLRQAEPMLGSDPYVYEDDGEDPDLPVAGGAAYGTRPPRRRHHSATAGTCFAQPLRPAGVSDAHYAQMVRQQRKWLNAPAQPPQPLSAAPLPPPPSRQYVRPRSSRPWPDGTAAPIPSREAEAASADAANRPVPVFQTVIHPKQLPPRPGDKGRTSRGTLSTSQSTKSSGGFAAASFINAISAAFSAAPKGKAPPRRETIVQQNNGGGGGAAAMEAQPSSRPTSAAVAATAVAALPSSASELPLQGAGTSSSIQLTYDSPRNGKRLPWEAREHVAAAAAVGIIPAPLSLEAGACGGGDHHNHHNHRSSSSDNATTSTNGRKATGGSTVGSMRQRSQHHQQYQEDARRRSSSVYGETLPPEGGSGAEVGEPFVARKFEIQDGLVLDGYMGR